MSRRKTVEQKTAEAILQQDNRIKIGRKYYRVAPSSYATIIMASAAISKLPTVDNNTENVVAEMFRVGRDCLPTGEALAILLVGAKGSLHYGLRRLIYRRKIRVTAARLMENLTNSELRMLGETLIKKAQLADFFGLTTFLAEANQLKPTREVETTASGQ